MPRSTTSQQPFLHTTSSALPLVTTTSQQPFLHTTSSAFPLVTTTSQQPFLHTTSSALPSITTTSQQPFLHTSSTRLPPTSTSTRLPSTSAQCQLKQILYDIALVIDVSANLSPAGFAAVSALDNALEVNRHDFCTKKALCFRWKALPFNSCSSSIFQQAVLPWYHLILIQIRGLITMYSRAIRMQSPT